MEQCFKARACSVYPVPCIGQGASHRESHPIFILDNQQSFSVHPLLPPCYLGDVDEVSLVPTNMLVLCQPKYGGCQPEGALRPTQGKLCDRKI